MMKIRIRDRGPGGDAPSKEMIKNGVICCILRVTKYDIINLKINSFKNYKTTTKTICMLSLGTNKRVFTIYKRELGDISQRHLKHQTKWSN